MICTGCWLLALFAVRCYEGIMAQRHGLLNEGIWFLLSVSGIGLFFWMDSLVSHDRRLRQSLLSKLALAVALFCVCDTVEQRAMPVRLRIDTAQEQAHLRDFAPIIAQLQFNSPAPGRRHGYTPDGARYLCAPGTPLRVFFSVGTSPGGDQRFGYLYDPSGGALEHDYDVERNFGYDHFEVITSRGDGWYRCRY